jgi:predicted Rossmann fold flavoprotein
VGTNWKVTTSENVLLADFVMIASGGNINMWQALDALDIELIAPVPSLFTFDAEHPLLNNHSGLSFENALVSIPKLKQSAKGPLLITHRGLSGPGILKLSAWAARELYELDYQFDIVVNWCGFDNKEAEKMMKAERELYPKKYPAKNPMFDIPRRFWSKMCEMTGISDERNWAETGKKQLNPLLDMCCGTTIQVNGKSTFKEEFVTAGGIDLAEMDLNTFGIQKLPGLYAAGEVLNIDAVTGGFNFQAAWTGAEIAAQGISAQLNPSMA